MADLGRILAEAKAKAVRAAQTAQQQTAVAGAAAPGVAGTNGSAASAANGGATAAAVAAATARVQALAGAGLGVMAGGGGAAAAAAAAATPEARAKAAQVGRDMPHEGGLGWSGMEKIALIAKHRRSCVHEDCIERTQPRLDRPQPPTRLCYAMQCYRGTVFSPLFF